MKMANHCKPVLLRVVCCASLLVAATSVIYPQITKVRQQRAGVDETRVGPYKALAQLSYKAFQAGDVDTAAELARILGRTFEMGEENSDKDSLSERRPEVFRDLDMKIAAYIDPLLHQVVFQIKTPLDPQKIRSSYESLINALNAAEPGPGSE